MRLWLSRSSQVPLREQLFAQITLGVVSGDLKAGEKLPSTRELARRFRIHSNTVSAAYRDLHRRGWVEFRKGSGVYVRERNATQTLDQGSGLDHLISTFLKTARTQGHSLGEITLRLKHWLTLQPPDHFLVIETDPELREILVAEIAEATGVRTVGASPKECADAEVLTAAQPIVMYGQAEKLRAAIPGDTDFLIIHSRSVVESMQGQKLPPSDALIAVVSRWPEFLRWSRTMLVAAGLDADALSFRDARLRGWQKGLSATTFVISDSLMARQLPAGCATRVFRVVSDSSIVELREYVEQFFN